MTTTVKAIYENGTLRLPGPLPLPERAEVTVTIQTDVEAATDGERTTWLKVSEDALTKAWENPADDDVFNELRQG
jgi:predicted DNA-binding antitoxin AbrB/MazE fold protein